MSAITYGRRALLVMIFNLAVGEDDDGNSAGDDTERLGDDQIENIKDALTTSGCPETTFLKWAKQERLTDIPAKHYDRCIEAIQHWKAAHAKKSEQKAASR